MSLEIKITLIGAPNVGKTTLFNNLTGKENSVGNWDGVTTEISKAHFNYLNNLITINDLPGCYSLVATKQMCLEEKFVSEYVNDYFNQDLFINIICLENLSRDLYLTLQLLEYNCNVILLLNINDKRLKYNLKKYHGLLLLLKDIFNLPVIPCNIVTGFGLEDLKKVILEQHNVREKLAINFNLLKKYIPCKLLNSIKKQATALSAGSIGEIIKLLEGDINIVNKYKDKNLQNFYYPYLDLFFAGKRHDFINKAFLIKYKKLYKLKTNNTITNKIDKLLLNKYLGLPIFLIIICLNFSFVTNLGTLLQNYFNDIVVNFIIHPINTLLTTFFINDYLFAILNNGLFVGISTIVGFIPIVFLMYLSLFILENSGYISRVVFLVDKLMKLIGLSGKSLIPMIVGFGCNVPAIAGAKVIEAKRDKIITILMTPFISCSARLVTYSIFVAAFFSTNQGFTIFSLYLIGIIAAIFTGCLLQKFLPGVTSNLIMELPPYSIPPLKTIFKKSIYRTKNFLKNSGIMIVLACILVALLKNIKLSSQFQEIAFDYVMPIFKPMGIAKNNWPAVASLLSGIIAKESIIGSLNSFYNVNAQDLLMTLSSKFANSKSVFSYLLFILLSFPCISVLASIKKELTFKWAVFSFVWSTCLAYLVAVCYYQIANLNTPFNYFKILCYTFLSIIICAAYIILKIYNKTSNTKESSIKKVIPIRLYY